MPLESFAAAALPLLEESLQSVIAQAKMEQLPELHEILTYHLGWQGEGAGEKARGKRIRPLLLLLTASSAGGDWKHALPSAAAVELIHNFSLIHDDIEDNSLLRRGRPTVWSIWGIPQAINAGDTLFALAHLAINAQQAFSRAEVVIKIQQRLLDACLALTQGQHLDILYESRTEMDLDAYYPMITGKTASLISTAIEIGARIAEAPTHLVEAYRRYGESLGLAFQVQDDYLGIWGDQQATGKSVVSDLLSGKKTLPVLYALVQNGHFAVRWKQGGIQPSEVPQLVQFLEEAGAKEYALETATRLTQEAFTALDEAAPQGNAGQALYELTRALLIRTS